MPHRCSRSAAPRRVADRGAQRCARGEDRVGIDIAADLAGDVGLARQRQRERDEGGLQRTVGEDRAERRHQPVVRRALAPPPRRCRDVVGEERRIASVCTACQRLNGIAVVRGKETQIVGREVGDELDRRREAAVERRHRRLARHR